MAPYRKPSHCAWKSKFPVYWYQMVDLLLGLGSHVCGCLHARMPAHWWRLCSECVSTFLQRHTVTLRSPGGQGYVSAVWRRAGVQHPSGLFIHCMRVSKNDLDSIPGQRFIEHAEYCLGLQFTIYMLEKMNVLFIGSDVSQCNNSSFLRV